MQGAPATDKPLAAAGFVPLVDLFVNRAHLALNDGAMFFAKQSGNDGFGFMRLNVGTPRAILRQALEQLRAAIAQNV